MINHPQVDRLAADRYEREENDRIEIDAKVTCGPVMEEPIGVRTPHPVRAYEYLCRFFEHA